MMFRSLATAAILFVSATLPALAADVPRSWLEEWPRTDFDRASVSFDEIMSGGPPKDGIPSIDDPRFIPARASQALEPTEPVIGLEIGGDARAYPLRILTWHEIVNDTVGGTPVAVTYCPLCNAAIVFDRRVDGRVLEFGTTGRLRHSDLVMYDRETESWWQQFLGEAIVGAMTGQRLTPLPARLESWQSFLARHPDGQVLVPNRGSFRPYGRNPYVGYDTRPIPFFYNGPLPEDVAPMAYVVAVGEQAWTLERLREAGTIRDGDLVLSWQAGTSSALDTEQLAEGRDIGSVTVQRQTTGGLEDVPYDLTFAFVFHAFRPGAPIHR